MKRRLIVIGPLPPPHHGVTVSTGLVLANDHLRERFDISHLDTSDRRPVSTIGRWDVVNVALGLRAAFRLLALTRGRKGVVYLPISQTVRAFLRDSLYIQIAAARRWRVAAHLRGSEFGRMYAQAPWLLRPWIRFTLRRLHSVAVMGESLRGVFDGLVPPDRIAVVWNGTPELEHNGVARDPRLGLFLSNLLRRKGVVEAVDAARIVVRECANARFVFAGDWEDERLRDELTERVRDVPDRIEFHPVVTGEAQRQLLRKAGFLLFPPVEPEGHPRVVIEALAAGLPVVTTNRGAIGETVVDGECGFVLDHPDPHRLAERVMALIEDERAWARMSGAARDRHRARYTVDAADRTLAEWMTRIAS